MSFFLVEKLSITVQKFSKWGVLKWQPPYTNGKFAQYHQNVDFARLTSVNSTSTNVPEFVILGHTITQCTVLESRCKTGVTWLNLLTGCSGCLSYDLTKKRKQYNIYKILCMYDTNMLTLIANLSFNTFVKIFCDFTW